MVAGPGTAKSEFASHLKKHVPQLKSRLLGVEPMGHPTDGELFDHARRSFKAAEKLRPAGA